MCGFFKNQNHNQNSAAAAAMAAVGGVVGLGKGVLTDRLRRLDSHDSVLLPRLFFSEKY